MPNANILFQNVPTPSLGANFRDAMGTQQAFNEVLQTPMRNRLLDAQTQGAEIGNQNQLLNQKIAQQGLDQKTALFQLGDMARDALAIKPLIQSGNTSETLKALEMRANKIKQRGGDPSDTIDFMQRIMGGQLSGEQAIQELDSVIDVAVRSGAIEKSSQGNMTADVQTFNYMRDIVAPALDANGNFDHTKATAEQKAAAAKLGLYAKEGTLSASERIANTPGQTNIVAGSQAAIAGAEAGASQNAKNISDTIYQPGIAGSKARAELMAELDLKPSVQAGVEKAIQEVQSAAKIKDQQRSDSRAFAVYESAMSGLFSALGDTATGPIVGFAPALTENQQIADGAVMAMLPVLKGVFRVAGEGVFTDRDQELLENMLPNRKTLPEARVSQLALVDSIVRSKMGQPVNVKSKVLGREVSMKDVFEEAQAEGTSVESVMRELGIE